MQAPLVATKLNIPPLQRELVPRPRLIERMDQGLEYKVILVSTPAGYGKTSLLSHWASRCRLPVAWVSLDEGENDLVRFLSYLIAAVGKVIPGTDEQLAPLLRGQKISTLDQVLADLINVVERAEKSFVLVLDDYHLIQEPAVHNAFIFLLEHFSPHVHLVIATRADPPLPLARLRARSQLTELRLADLAFTQAEAACFLNDRMKISLRDDQIAVLNSRTEGWAAGLQMAAITLRGSEDRSERVRSFSGSNRFILDYLGEEVLDSQPEVVQSFLMKTSILERLSGPLCAAVTGLHNSQEILDRLEHDNLFIISLDPERAWYRFHPLFLELLRKRAQARFASQLSEWHRSASLWFEQNGELEGAVHHALATGDFERSARLLELAAQPFLMRSEIYTFQNWINGIPQTILRGHPDLVLFYTWVLALSGSTPDAIEEYLGWIDPRTAGTAGRMGVIRGYIKFSQGDILGGIALLKQSLADLPPEEDLFHGVTIYLLSIASVMVGEFESGSQMLKMVVERGLRKGQVMLAAGALCNLAEVHLRLGQLQEAREDYERVLQVAQSASGRRLPIAAKALFGLGELWLEWNDLDLAEANCLEGFELAPYLREAVMLNGYITLARVRQARGDANGAQQAMQKAWDIALATRATDVDDLYVKLYQAALDLQAENFDAVERWIREKEFPMGSEPPAGQNRLAEIRPADFDRKEDFYKYHLLKYELMIYTRWLIARGYPLQALYWLDMLCQKMEEQGRTNFLIIFLLQRALAHHKRGDTAQALSSFERCFVLAEPGGYVRLFLEAGEAVRPLLEAMALRSERRAYASRLLAALDAPLDAQDQPAARASQPAGRSPDLDEALTGREIELLALVAEGLSNQEIAQRLYISLPTVKWHIGNILGKLGVRSRTQAVAQARALGLLDR